MRKIPFCDKDALGREKIIKNGYFFVPPSTFLDAEMPYLQWFQRLSLSEYMKERIFRPPLNHFKMNKTQKTRYFAGVELSPYMKENEKLIVLRDTELIFVMKNVLFIIVVWLLLIQPMKEKKKMGQREKTKERMKILRCEKIFFRKQWKALILLGFKVLLPFFLLCIDIYFFFVSFFCK